MHYRISTTRHQHTMAQLWHTVAWYDTLWSSTTIRTSFIIVLKIAITKHQNHSIPAVWCTEIALHPISPHDWHLHLLSSSPSITRSYPWGCTLLLATVIQYEGSQSLAISHLASFVIGRLAPYVLPSIFIIISFQRSAFIPPSLLLFLCTLLYSLCSENFIFLIHLFTFKLFHLFSHLIKFCYFTATFLTYKNPCI